MKHDDYLLSFQGTPEFSADEAAALWCGIDPYSQQAEYFYESAFHSLYDPARRAIMLANASDKKKQYYSIYAYIHGAMATTNAQPQRQDKIPRSALVGIANALQEKPAFLFPNGRVINQQSIGDGKTAKQQEYDDGWDKAIELLRVQDEIGRQMQHIDSLDPVAGEYNKWRKLAHDELAQLEGEQAKLRQWFGSGNDNQQSSIDKLTPVKLMQKNLIEGVREHLQEQKENYGKTNRMEALRGMEYSGELRRIGYTGNEILPKVRKLTDPNQVKKMELSPLPR